MILNMNAQKITLSVLSLSSHQEKNPGGRRRNQHPSHLETRLSMIGYDVVTAADGEEALHFAKPIRTWFWTS